MTAAALHTRRPAAAHPRTPDDQATRLRAMVEAVEHAPPLRAERFELLPHRDPGAPRAKVVTVSSGKGGVGKTNTCVNLAVALAQSGRRTTLLDADMGMANADVLCGVSPTRRLEHYVGVSDLATGGRPRTPADAAALARRSLADLAVDAPGGFRLVPGAVGVARMADLAPRERARLMAGLVELEHNADVLLVDTGAGLGREVISFVHAADLALIVATPEPTSIADAYALIKCVLRTESEDDRARNLRNMPVAHRRLALVINEAADAREAAAVHARIAGVCEKFLRTPLPLLGWVSQDPRVGAAVRRRNPVLLDCAKCPASKDLRSLAAALLAVLDPPSPPAQGDRGISGWLKRLTLRGS
jgi:flagellar biosynthesis protein FlhG